ncbi:hypothetical protein [Streptomyces botrytidirepellens]|uniref:Uncharacterized protein n=1 Tax=Streptomyces botrytidirepellens TaxID=2486417 RepID=A0A3M8T5Y7_9ACTN|nr:hypothetical protein [Streptomyces botrytidirepellens]RNF86630.1 hypothetical protein EEJ42_42980 [Streptomyces botrytidirepellens]
MKRPTREGTRSGNGAGSAVRAAVQPHHIVAFGLTLSSAALCERLLGGRAYALCDEPPLLGDLTTAALCLVLAAAVTAVVGAWVTQEKAPHHRAVPWVFLAVVAALIVTADGIDAYGEREAAAIAAQEGSDGVGGCEEAVQIYVATPGWFFW